MKIFWALVIWMLLSFILTLSIIGCIVWVRADEHCERRYFDEGRSTWAKIGWGLYQKLIQ